MALRKRWRIGSGGGTLEPDDFPAPAEGCRRGSRRRRPGGLQMFLLPKAGFRIQAIFNANRSRYRRQSVRCSDKRSNRAPNDLRAFIAET
jgi:hypothetical protein